MRTEANAVSRRKLAAPCIALALVAATIGAAHAEHWIQASATDSRVWYDADNVRATTNHLIGIWVSTGPNRTNPGADGVTSYPTYSVVNCQSRTAGSKMSLDLGQALQPFAPSSGMGELIAKFCS
jgi:hypothetical protein